MLAALAAVAALTAVVALAAVVELGAPEAGPAVGTALSAALAMLGISLILRTPTKTRRRGSTARNSDQSALKSGAQAGTLSRPQRDRAAGRHQQAQ